MNDWYNYTKRWLQRFTLYAPVRILPFQPRPRVYIEVYDPITNTVVMTAPRETVRRMWHAGQLILRYGRFYLAFPKTDEEELEESLKEIDRIVHGEKEVELMSEEES